MSGDVGLPFDPVAYHGEHEWNPKVENPRPAWIIDADGDVIIRCACGLLIGHPFKHSIAEDGTVRASLLHTPSGHDERLDPGETCTWHVFGRLLDWEDGAKAENKRKLAPNKLARKRAARGEALP